MHRGRCVLLASLTGVLAVAGWASRPAVADVPGWSDQTVGDTLQGSASIDANGVITVTGAGADTWAREDEFHVVYKPLKGDGSVTTKMLSVEEGHDAAKLGVVMRNDLEDTAAAGVFMIMSGNSGGQQIHRGVAGEEMSMDFKTAKSDYHLFPKEFPVWLKIERRGDRFTSYASPDGQLWTPVTRALQISMKEEIVAGLSVMSHDDESFLTATYDGNVTEVSNRLLKPEEATPQQPDVVALGGNNSVLLVWERINHHGKEADGYIVYKAEIGDTEFTQIAELAGDKTSFVDETIANGEMAQYRVTTVVNVGDQTLESRDLGDHLYAVTGSPNPPIKIGDRDYYGSVLEGGAPQPPTEVPGSASIDSNGVVTLQASGWDIQDRNDGGHQLMTPVTGDFTFTARALGAPEVEGDEVNEWAKFGVAVRETTLSDSRYAAMLITPAHGIRSPHRRLFETGLSHDLGPNEDEITYPITLRIQRRGNVITMFTSADGTTFTEYGEPAATTLEGLVPNVYIGLIGTSHDNAQVAQARFDTIQLTTP